MTILIVVASRHGSTTEIANGLAEEIRSNGFDVALVSPPESLPNENIDAVIVGSAVYVGRWLAAARQFVEQNRDQLSKLPVWLFSSGPIGDPLKPEAGSPDLDDFARMIGAKGCRTFPGTLKGDDLGLKERLLVKIVGAQEGDFRDWSDIRHWADEIADTLRREQSPQPI